MRVRYSALMLMVLAILIGLPATAVARSEDPNNPEALLPGEELTGTLPGSPAGSFAFFTVEYPGGDQELVIRMTPRPADPSVAQQIAFNVYGPDGLVGSSRVPSEGDPSVRELRYTASGPVRLLVQLYNYTLTTTIGYSIVATGISEHVPMPPTTPAPAPEAPVTLPEAGAPPVAPWSALWPAPLTPTICPTQAMGRALRCRPPSRPTIRSWPMPSGSASMPPTGV